MNQLTWTDITDYVLGPHHGARIELSEWQRQVLTVQLDNRKATFKPKPKRVRVRVADGPYRVYHVACWDELHQVRAAARQRCSRMHAAYRRRRR